MRRALCPCAFAGTLAAFFVQPATAAVINVPADQPTIQAAIDVAGSSDEVIVAPGVYHEIIDLKGKRIYLHSAGGSAVTTIDASSVQDPGDGKPVVRCDSFLSQLTTIEGFTLTGGTGDSTWGGGGMLIRNNCSATVRNCRFVDNTASVGGGCVVQSGNPTFAACTFVSNSATGSGGGLYVTGSSIQVSNCIFDRNTTGMHGGGLYGLLSTVTLVNTTFVGNTATVRGGGIHNASSNMPISNSIVWGNTDGAGSGAASQIYPVSDRVTYSNVQGGTVGPDNIDADPAFVDPDGPNNIPGDEDDDLHLAAGSPCIDTGNDADAPGDQDLDGAPRIRGCMIDMGAYEAQAIEDADGDGVADGCDLCPGFDDLLDADNDGVPDGCDLCAGYDDSADADTDGLPDDCDSCYGDNATGDADMDGFCDNADYCSNADDAFWDCAGCPFPILPDAPTDYWTAVTSDESAGYQRFESYEYPGEICQVRWWGIGAISYGFGYVYCGWATDFNVTFYPDLNGVPDLANPTCQYLNVNSDDGNPRITTTGLVYRASLDYDLYRYDLDLTDLGCCNQHEGWISIQSTDTSLCWFLHMSAAGKDGSSCAMAPMANEFECGADGWSDFDLSLCLNGPPIAAGACCDNAVASCTDDPPVDYVACLQSGTDMRFVPNGSCSDLDPPCGVTYGACCFDDTTCTVISNVECDARGGVYQGQYTDCSDTHCPLSCPCSTTIDTYPYRQGFEVLPLCAPDCAQDCPVGEGWTNMTGRLDGPDWIVHEGATPTADTGPMLDANSGLSTGNYLYIEAGDCGTQASRLLSPCFDLTSLSSPVMSFAYYLYGDIGGLYVFIALDGCQSFDRVIALQGGAQTSDTEPWKYATIDLSPYAGTTNVRFEFAAVPNSNEAGDIAIDDFAVGERATAPGACCNETTCLDSTLKSDCLSQGGYYLGPFTNCGGVNPCEAPCCAPDATCQLGSRADCETLGGFFGTPGRTCQRQCAAGELCETATVIDELPFHTVVDNTMSFPDGPPGECASTNTFFMYNDVWYRFSPSADCRFQLDVDPDFGVDYDALMQLHVGPDCDALRPLAGLEGEDYAGCFHVFQRWHVDFTARTEQTYWVQIGSRGSLTSGGQNAIDLTCDPIGLCRGDLDANGAVSLADAITLVNCLTGPDKPAGQSCDIADLDGDLDADLTDFAQIQAYFEKPCE